MKAIIIDDEPRAITLIEKYLEHFESIEVVGTFRNGLKALEFINQNHVDLIFMDINMPHISGLAISKLLDKSIQIIFTTAHPEFAVESYEVNTVDYLLKPITMERFTVAVQKILDKHAEKSKAHNPTLIVKSGAKSYRVKATDILFLRKEGNYMIYHIQEQKILARETIAEALNILPDHFMQVHKSYIVNMHQIEYLNKEEISVGTHLIPIGNSFKEEVLKMTL